MATPKKIERLSFEDAIEELESIIDQVESGEAGLEQSLAFYERGMRLVARCKSVLDSAEKKIAELTTTQEGRLKVKPESSDSAGDVDGDLNDTDRTEEDDDTPF